MADRPAADRPGANRAAGSRAGASRAARTAPIIPQLAWNAIRPAAIVLVSGSESFLAERAIRRLRDLLTLEDPSLEVADLDAAEYSAGELFSRASPSLFGEPRLIRVSSVERCADSFLADALRYLASPAEDCYLILRYGASGRGKKLLEAIRSLPAGAIEVSCAELKKDAEKFEFAAAEFRVQNRRITPGALRAVVAAFTDNLAELASACQQLIADSNEEITESTVEKYYAGRVEAGAFRVADAAIAGRRGEALGLLRHALASGADPVPMVAAFAAKLRTMAKMLGARGSVGQIASEFGLAPWQVERARRDLQGWSEDGLGACIQVLAETDAQIKGLGRDPVYALEQMVATVAARGAAA